LNEVLSLQAGLIESLAGIAEAEIVDERAAERSGVACSQAFAIGMQDLARRLPGELRSPILGDGAGSVGAEWKRALRFVIVVQHAAHKQAMVPVRGQVVIQLRYVGILL
jgi:hypothetical protein